MRVVAAIPARFGSQRLPGKPLLPLGGLPIVAHVIRAAQAARLVKDVIVATDHPEIASVAEREGATAVMTDSSLPSGTDRIEAALRLIGATHDVVVNVQGDEPLLDPQAIDLTARLLIGCPDADMSTLSAPLPSQALLDPNKVKVVCRPAGEASRSADSPAHVETPASYPHGLALYFSRGPIGVERGQLSALLGGSACNSNEAPVGHHACRLHLGIYGFRIASLRRFVALPPSQLEKLEKLEQLRALEAGMQILVGEVTHAPHGIDTLADLEAARALLGLGE